MPAGPKCCTCAAGSSSPTCCSNGPADLSWDEAAAIVADATGRPLRAEQIPDDEMRQALTESGMGNGLVDAVMGMSTGLRDALTPEQARDATTTTPTTLASWSYDVLRRCCDSSDSHYRVVAAPETEQSMEVS